MDAEFLFRVAKALIEVAGFAYLGQGLVGLLSGGRRDENVVYQIFRVITSPATRVTRFLMPAFIPDRHIPFVAFGLLLWAWIFTLVGLANVLRGG